MTCNLAARNFSLTIANQDRTEQVVTINLSSSELDDSGVIFITGTVVLAVPHHLVNSFSFLLNPAHWYRGAPVIYQIANDSGTLVNHPLSGGGLYLLRNASRPDSSYRLELEIGCQLALRNFDQPDSDESGVALGQVTSAHLVVENYLTKAGITYSLTSMPYNFNTPVPKQGGSYIETAGAICRSRGYFLRCDPDGVARNYPINLSVTQTPVITLSVGQNEAEFEPIDSNQEIPVERLKVIGTGFNAEGSYPKVTIDTQQSSLYFPPYRINNPGYVPIIFEGKLITYISERTTFTDFGFAGNVRTTRIYKEANVFQGQTPLLFPIEQVVTVQEYDSVSGALIKETVTTTKAGVGYSFIKVSNFSVGSIYLGPLESKWQSPQEVVKTYNYDANLRLKSIVEKNGDLTITTSWQEISRDTWLFSEITNRSVTLNLGSGQKFDIPETKSKIANDGSTLPPPTQYKQDKSWEQKEFVAEVSINTTGVPTVAPRERIINASMLVSNQQAQEYGENYLKILLGRSQGYQLLFAYSTTILNNLRPLSCIDVHFDGLSYRFLVDGLSASASVTEAGLACKGILIATYSLPSGTPTGLGTTRPFLSMNMESGAEMEAFYFEETPLSATFEVGVELIQTPTFTITNTMTLEVDAEMEMVVEGFYGLNLEVGAELEMSSL